MKQEEFYKKVLPEWHAWREEAMQSPECVYLSAFEVAFAKEAMWRLDETELCDPNYDWDEDRERIEKFFDDVDPKWFMRRIVLHAGRDDDAGMLFVRRNAEELNAHQYFMELLGKIIGEWYGGDGNDGKEGR